MGRDLTTQLVLDYDLRSVMNMQQHRLSMSIRWKKVDSHIETRVYKDGQTPAGDEFSIRLNIIVDVWASTARKVGQIGVESVRSPQFFYDERQIMVKTTSQRFIYGNITGIFIDKISQVGLIAYLREKNPRWTDVIFHTIDWDSIGSCTKNMAPHPVSNVE